MTNSEIGNRSGGLPSQKSRIYSINYLSSLLLNEVDNKETDIWRLHKNGNPCSTVTNRLGKLSSEVIWEADYVSVYLAGNSR